jgi:hypothetical protein
MQNFVVSALTKIVRRGLFGTNPPPPSDEESVSSDNNADLLFDKIRSKCKNQAASQIKHEFIGYKAVQQECKRRNLGAKGHMML